MLGAVPPLPHYVFMAWGLVKHGDNFTLIVLVMRNVHTKKP
jgi:hypothetical protein